MYPTNTDRAAVEIDEEALGQNYRRLHAFATAHSQSRSVRTIAVVKANAYGHGFFHTVLPLLKAGCRFFAVATLGEALAVRRYAPTAAILILGYTAPQRAPVLAAHDLTQTVFSREYAAWLSHYAVRAACRVKVHFKVDIGMCRLGFAATDTAAILQAASLPHLIPCGLFSHFPCADHDLTATRVAFLRFLACRNALRAEGLSLFSHAAASAALLALPDTALDGVRIGLALYGIPPVKTALPLTPTLTLTAPVVQIRRVAAGTPVGYGGAFVTKRPSKIGILPIGYGDGLRRDFENAVGGVRFYCRNMPFFAPIAGHICMDMTAVDLTNTPVTLGDRATVFSDPRPVATALHTIPWEVLTALHPRIPRKRRTKSAGLLL